jgi:hypothetical protein
MSAGLPAALLPPGHHGIISMLCFLLLLLPLLLLLQTIPGTDGETATQGLDNLGAKCKEVRALLLQANHPAVNASRFSCQRAR